LITLKDHILNTWSGGNILKNKMALYINDPDICKLALSPFGIQSIKKFITEKDGEEPIFEKRMTISGFGYNLLTRCWSSSDGVNFKKDEKRRFLTH
jgi:hypothetical protein